MTMMIRMKATSPITSAVLSAELLVYVVVVIVVGGFGFRTSGSRLT